MIKKAKTMLTIFLVFCAFQDYAQNVAGNMGIEDSQMPGAKNDASGNMITVDPYTGTGSIAIPIHSYSVDGLSLNTSLNYSCKGVQLDAMASDVGLNWALSAGGDITREVNGLEDEVTLPTTYGLLTDSMQGVLVTGATSATLDDAESDLFHLNLAGRGIDFSFKTATSILTVPKSYVQIEVIAKDWRSGAWTNIRKGFQHKSGLNDSTDIITFNVIDEMGNKFFFERGDYYRPKTFMFRGSFLTPDSGSYYPTRSWILDKIVTSQGKIVQYHYDTTHVEYAEAVTETLYPKDQDLYYEPLEIKEVKWTGIKYHIKQIDYPDGTTVYFDASKALDSGRCDCQRDFRLRKIKIEKKYDTYVKNSVTYRLHQSYFNSPQYNLTAHEIAIPSSCSTLAASLTVPSGLDADSARKMHLARGLRLRLNSIDRVGTDDTSSEPYYSFNYANSASIYTAMPYRFTAQKDFFGYFNNESVQPYKRQDYVNNSDTDIYYLSIPYHRDHNYYNTQAVYTPYWGAYRNQDTAYMKYWTIDKVFNGLGSEMDISYKANYNLSNPYCAYSGIRSPYGPTCIIDPNLQGGDQNDGLLLSRVVTKNRYSPEHTVTKDYFYDQGERFQRGDYTWYATGSLPDTTFTNFFLAPFNYVNGSNHGFSSVTTITTGLTERLGKSRSTFSNLMYRDGADTFSNMTLSTGDAYHNAQGELRKSRMGLLLKTEDYDVHDSLIKTTENDYELATYAPGAIYAARNGVQEYRILSNELMRLTGTTITHHDWDPSTDVPIDGTTTYAYTYGDSNNLHSVSWADSKGDTYKKYRYYNYDYSGKYGYAKALDTMDKRILKSALSNEIWKMTGSDSILISYSLSVPKYLSATNSIQYPTSFTAIMHAPLTSTQVFPSSGPGCLDFDKAFNYESNTSYGSNLMRQTVITLYDPRNNPLEVLQNDQGIYTSSIWDTSTGEKIAGVNNAQYRDIAYTSFESKYAASGTDYNKGNWDFDPSTVTHTPGITGNYAYGIAAFNKTITSQPLQHKKYILSFWLSTGTSGPLVNLVDLSAGTHLVSYTPYKNTTNSWYLYTTVISPDSGWKLEITGNGGVYYIDELRLYPTNASMSSTTYNPLCGTQDNDDANNYITYYEYDVFNRLHIVRDLRKNIIKKIETGYNTHDIIVQYDPTQASHGGNTYTY